ncbi:MAG: hypothetical protein QM662_11260 [Gordonia sp. (in: high G+C Gram-positive bacteria)]
MGERSFSGVSTIDAGRLALALAPALTPDGVDDDPSFFHGLARHPVVLGQGLLALADVTATRYFQYVPTALRDPVLTAHGDRLRAECFSACNGVYARFDILADGLADGTIGRGTTNVDINLPMRMSLNRIRRTELFHLDVGTDGLTASTPRQTTNERPVAMPDRWIRALGNVAELHHGATAAFHLDKAATRRFLGSLPAATATAERGWLVAGRGGARLSKRAVPDGVFVHGLNRLDVLRRMLLHATGLTAYTTTAPPAGDGTPSLFEVELPGARPRNHRPGR